MHASATSSRLMFRRLLAPFIFVLFISIALIGGLSVVVLHNQDRGAIQDSVHMVQSVLADMERRLSDQLIDYSYWDEAVHNLVSKQDMAWADRNIGIYMHERFRIATSFVLAPDNQLVYSMIDGKRSRQNPFDLFSGGLKAIVEKTKSHAGTEPPVPATGFLRNGGAIHIVAASILTRFKKEGHAEKQELIATGSVLIFSRAFDASLIDELSNNYLLDNLRLVSTESELLSASIPLRTASGEFLGYLTWQAKSPSEGMVHWLTLLMGAALLLFTGSASVFMKKAQSIVAAMERSHAEREDLQERLRHDQMMKDLGLMAGGIAHEFNNLFQGITANLEILRQKPLAAVEQEKLIDSVLDAAFKGGGMTDQLLSYVGKKPARPEVICLGQYVTDVIDFMRPVLPETIEIQKPSLAGKWPIQVDVSQLRASVVNLLLNARDAMPSGGRIRVDIGKVQLDETATKNWSFKVSPGEYACLTVADNGGGIAPDVLDRIMQPFFTTKEVGKGTGLGLSMVYGFVKKSGGYVKIDSELGRGTEVKLLFPLLEQSEIADSTRAMEREHSLSEEKTILYVEDNDNVRDALVRVMKILGYRVLAAENGMTALKILDSSERIDLLLSDILMPGGLSGVELANKVKAARPEIRIMLITAYSDEELGRHANAGAGYPVLRKPIQVKALAEALNQVL